MPVAAPNLNNMFMSATYQLPRQRQFKTQHAFELAFGLAAALWIDFGLALLAEIGRLHFCERAAFDRLLAALLDEGTEHRRFAVLRRQVDAIPAVAAIARV